MTDGQRIQKMEAKGWEYVEGLRLNVAIGQQVEIPQAWIRGNKYRTYKNGKFSQPKNR